MAWYDLRWTRSSTSFLDFVSTFTNAVIDHLEALGRSDPYIVGEWSNGGVGQQNSLMFVNNYDYFKTRILDFQLSFALNRFIGGGYEYPVERTTGNELGEFLGRRVQAFHGNDDWMGTFLDNHDEIRTMTRLDKIGVPTETERRHRMDLATVVLMTFAVFPSFIMATSNISPSMTRQWVTRRSTSTRVTTIRGTAQACKAGTRPRRRFASSAYLRDCARVIRRFGAARTAPCIPIMTY
jgi:Glycosidases